MDEFLKDILKKKEEDEKTVSFKQTRGVELAKDLYELRLIQTITLYNCEPTPAIIQRQFSFNQRELEEMATVINQSSLGLKAEVAKVGSYVWTEIR